MRNKGSPATSEAEAKFALELVFRNAIRIWVWVGLNVARITDQAAKIHATSPFGFNVGIYS